MDCLKLRIGNCILYDKKPYCIGQINPNKLGLISCEEYRCYDHRDVLYNLDKMKFVKTSLCEPIPLLEVLTNDDRFGKGKVQVDKGKQVGALVWTPVYSKDLHIALIEDGEYVGSYRIIINNDEWNQKLPIISMARISSFHEFQNILMDCDVHIYFSLRRHKK